MRSDRAREWTSALAQWCEAQPEHGRLHRRLPGASRRDHAAARRLAGGDRGGAARLRACVEAANRQAAAAAFYQQAEVHRLRGEFAAAEEAYRSASEWGREPQPGLALLRLAQGRTDAAAAAIRRVAGRDHRAAAARRLLPACVEIMLAAGDIEEARGACRELEGIARSIRYRGAAAQSPRRRAGAVELAEGDAEAALGRCVAPGRSGSKPRRRTGRARARAGRAGLPRARRRRRRRAGA